MADRSTRPGAPTRGRIGELDLHLFAEGTHRRLHDALGAHVVLGDDGAEEGVTFAVWAPNAEAATVVAGEREHSAGLTPVGDGGIWSVTVAEARSGDAYHFRITEPGGRTTDRLDPMARRSQTPPSRRSVVDRSTHQWGDAGWLAARPGAATRRLSIYEVHLGSWGRTVGASGRFPTYRELAAPLADHAVAHGFTHVELLPVTEHPFYGSWGYQCTGYFSPTARYGTPDDLRYLVDHLHQRGVGVVLDWVPSHFASDPDALVRFDGTHLYEHADPRQGYHPDWGSAIFNYGRNEVRSFLVSSAMHWIEDFHMDGLRLDAVASMLYLDYSRRAGEWVPNVHGGRENLEAIEFLRQLNEAVHDEHPDVLTIAEESTAWPGVTAPVTDGGLGFDRKWDMGWMHDTLRYLTHDPVHRAWHHHDLTFRSIYATSERFVLPLSHDEVVHGKGTLLTRQRGDEWQRFANLRLLLGNQWLLPGAPLLFMGAELAATLEWDHEATLDWSLHDAPGHGGVRHWVAALNQLADNEPAVWRGDDRGDGFEWVVADDAQQSVYVFLRHDPGGGRPLLVVANFTPEVRRSYRVGVPDGAAGSPEWRELLCSDEQRFGGSGLGTGGPHRVEDVPAHGHPRSIELTVPPLAVSVLAPTG